MNEMDELNLTEEEINALINSLGTIDKKIYVLFNQGFNQSEIAKQIGFSRQEVSRRIIGMRKKGIEFKKGLSHLSKKSQRVLELIKQGLSRDQIAKQLNIDIITVNGCISSLRRYGFEFTVKRKAYPKKSDSLDDIDREILRLRKNGKTIDQISQKIHRTKLTVINRINKMKALNIDTSKINAPIISRNKKIIELYVNGVNVKEIAKAVGICYAGVVKAIKKNKSKIYENDTCKRILQLYESGIKPEEIASRMQISLKKLYKILERIGLDARSQRNREIAELFLNGTDVKIIAQKFEMTETSIRDILSKTGVRKRRLKSTKKQQNTTKLNKGVSKEKLTKAIHNLIESRHATEEQIAVIAEYYGVELEVVQKIGKYIDRDER